MNHTIFCCTLSGSNAEFIHPYYLFVLTSRFILSFFSLDHGEHLRITLGLQKCKYLCTHKYTNAYLRDVIIDAIDVLICLSVMIFSDACDLTLDPNTAHTRLSLSAGNKKTKCERENQPYPDHPDRFENCEQVLCKERLTGRCYWEVEWSGWGHVAVTYKGISRKGGSDCRFGLNEKSWNIYCCDTIYSVWHNNKSTNIPRPSPSNRVGVYLDWPAGTLSFYSVSDTHTLTHLHTFNTTFTEPLYAGFLVYRDSSVFLCPM